MSSIVQGITPWQSKTITVPGAVNAGDWPPAVDHERIEQYADYRNLIENRPDLTFTTRLGLRPDQLTRVVLAAGLPEFVCNVWADALYGENSPDVTFTADATRQTWDAIWEANGGDDVLGWQSIFGAGVYGTTIEQIYRDEQGQIRIESIPPSIYFPTLKAGSATEIESVTIAWSTDEAGKRPLQTKRDYSLLEGEQLLVVTSQRRAGETSWNLVDETRPEGVDFLPFVDTHAKRWVGRFWGVSELARNMSLFEEVDATLSRIGSVLDYHGEPVLQVPASVLFGGVLPKGADRVIGVRNPAEAEIARYVDLPGHVPEQLTEVEKIVDLILLTSEIEKTYVGDTASGAASGTALRLMLQGYMKKVGRWQRKDEARITKIADYALRLAGVDDPAQRKAKYQAGSPLPVDDEQEVRILSMMLADGTISRKSYMTATRRFDDVDAEIRQIDSEQQTTAPSGFGLPAGVPTTTPGAQGAVAAVGAPPETRAGA